MALKPDRKYTVGTDISYFMNAVAERGGVVIFERTAPVGSGAAMDQANAIVVPTGQTQSGTYPAGLLVNDMVNLDLTRQHINWHQDQMQLGGKVTVLRQGDVVTNVIDTGVTPSPGDPCYYVTQSFVGAAQTYTSFFVLTTTSTNSTRVGTFLSAQDTNGYAKVAINML